MLKRPHTSLSLKGGGVCWGDGNREVKGRNGEVKRERKLQLGCKINTKKKYSTFLQKDNICKFTYIYIYIYACNNN